MAQLFKKDKCTDQGCEAMPVSTWQRTGIPVIIGAVLFLLAIAVLFFIVRRRRQKTRREESAQDQKIDMEDLEMDEESSSKKPQKHNPDDF